MQQNVLINIRAKERQRNLIDQAAQRLGRTRTDFILEVACREAEKVLLEQTFFTLDTENFEKFAEMIGNPPEPNSELLKLMRTKAPWES